ncbi:MAG: hypothetical protein M0Z96_09425 [Actinomycetota bacterium]|nr:hypothetical protein [Actinomycetota bacterium]
MEGSGVSPGVYRVSPGLVAWATFCLSDEEIPTKNDPLTSGFRSEKEHAKDATETKENGQVLYDLAFLPNFLAPLTCDATVFTKGVKMEKLFRSTHKERRVFELFGASITTALGPGRQKKIYCPMRYLIRYGVSHNFERKSGLVV